MKRWKLGYGGQEGDNYAVIIDEMAQYPVCVLEPNGYAQENVQLIIDAPGLRAAVAALTAERDALRAELAANAANITHLRAQSELLSWIVEFIAEHEEWARKHFFDGGYAESEMAWYEQARAALAKAGA